MFIHEPRRVEYLQAVNLLKSAVGRGSLLICLTVLSSASDTLAEEMQAGQNVAVYTQSPRQVADALTSILVERKELPAAAAPELATGLAAAVEEREEGRFSSQSVDLSREDLQGLVPEEFRQYVSDAGGRYVVSITLQPGGEGGTRVTIVPTLIATVPAADGPLGGRILRSNGTLESEIFQAMAARLGG